MTSTCAKTGVRGNETFIKRNYPFPTASYWEPLVSETNNMREKKNASNSFH